MTILIIVGIIVLLGIIFASMYNSLVKLRNNRENAFADIDVQLKQRHTVRLKRAAQLLEKSQMRVNEVALECGFNDVKLFRKYFKDEFGRLPSDYHK